MRCVKICKKLTEFIKSSNCEIEGEIHSIFSSAINILTHDKVLISVIKEEKGLGPYSVAVNCKENFLNIPIKAKEKVYINSNTVRFSKVSIDLNTDLSIDLSTGLMKTEKLNMMLIDNRTRDLKKYLLINGNTQGILSILPSIEAIVKENKMLTNDSTYGILIPKVNRFINALKYRTYDDLSNITMNVVGFGMGLTPSSDDFLCGMMAAILYGSIFTDFSKEYFLEIFELMVKNIKNRTTLVSENFLLNSSRGLYPLFMKELCETLFLEETYDKYEFRTLVQKALSFGETSGSDILCGIYIGTTIIKDYFGGLEYE